MTIRVLAVASEAFPLVKTGGLADVVGALPAALAGQGVATTTMLPGYPAVLDRLDDAVAVHRWDDLFGTPARLLAARSAGLDLLVLDAPALWARDGGPYSDADGRDWDDNWRRFAALSRAAADVASGRAGCPGFDLLHAHDWQAGLAPAFLRYDGAAGVRSVLTIHNIAFQGWFDAGIFGALGLPPSAWSIEGVEYHGGVGTLKAGLWAADAITTVSPTYAREIRRPAFGMGLEGLIDTRRGDLHGIVNGIDPDVWNPATDAALAAAYGADGLDARDANRAAVEAAFGLEPDRSGPLLTIVSRLTAQKGMDLVAAALDGLVRRGMRLALLGSGDRALEDAFRAGAARHPGRIGVRIGYDERLSHLLQGGADAILIPSRFEPCGLTQLYGLAYGCVPVVARTGGLADTVIDANEAARAAGVATGIVMAPDDADALDHALDRIGTLHADREGWRRMQRAGMAGDWGWARSAARYARLYRDLLDR